MPDRARRSDAVRHAQACPSAGMPRGSPSRRRYRSAGWENPRPTPSASWQRTRPCASVEGVSTIAPQTRRRDSWQRSATRRFTPPARRWVISTTAPLRERPAASAMRPSGSAPRPAGRPRGRSRSARRSRDAVGSGSRGCAPASCALALPNERPPACATNTPGTATWRQPRWRARMQKSFSSP